MTTETFNRIETALGETFTLGILGYKRRGKSLLASKLCYDLYLESQKINNPIRILHMGNLSFGEQIENISILADQDPNALTNCLLYIDEVKAIMNSRRSNSAFQQLIFNNLMQIIDNTVCE